MNVPPCSKGNGYRPLSSTCGSPEDPTPTKGSSKTLLGGGSDSEQCRRSYINSTQSDTSLCNGPTAAMDVAGNESAPCREPAAKLLARVFCFFHGGIATTSPGKNLVLKQRIHEHMGITECPRKNLLEQHAGTAWWNSIIATFDKHNFLPASDLSKDQTSEVAVIAAPSKNAFPKQESPPAYESAR